MVWVRLRRPPVLQSKLLCLSLLYLLTTLPLAIYVSFSDPNRRCLILPFQSTVKPIFQYPPGYGERKHALTVLRALCFNPVIFPEYKTALEEINGLCRNLSASPSALWYQKGTRDSFAGNLSTEERRSFFSHTDNQVEIPCGFFKELPLREVEFSGRVNEIWMLLDGTNENSGSGSGSGVHVM